MFIVDTREQLPYWTGSACFKTALCVGDYTTTLLHNNYHIERKSMPDLYQTITKGHSRFRREIFRAWEKKIRFSVYVEGTKEGFLAKRFPRGSLLQVKTETLRKIIRAYEEKYMLDIVWCKSRIIAKRMIEKRLKDEEKKLVRSNRKAVKGKSSARPKQRIRSRKVR